MSGTERAGQAYIELEGKDVIETEADVGGRRCAAAEKLRRRHGKILPMCTVIGAALAITGDGALGSVGRRS